MQHSHPSNVEIRFRSRRCFEFSYTPVLFHRPFTLSFSVSFSFSSIFFGPFLPFIQQSLWYFLLPAVPAPRRDYDVSRDVERRARSTCTVLVHYFLPLLHCMHISPIPMEFFMEIFRASLSSLLFFIRHSLLFSFPTATCAPPAHKAHNVMLFFPTSVATTSVNGKR